MMERKDRLVEQGEARGDAHKGASLPFGEPSPARGEPAASVRVGTDLGTGAPAERLRLFVALALPPEWREALAAAQADLRRAGANLRYVPPQNLHLTLLFLGSVSRGRLPPLRHSLSIALAEMPPFTLTLAGLDLVGSRRRPRVVVATIGSQTAALARLQLAVQAVAAPYQTRPEPRPFRPHITLARVPEGLPAEETTALAPRLVRGAPPPAATFEVRSVALVQSFLGDGSPRYEPLQHWPLAGHQ